MLDTADLPAIDFVKKKVGIKIQPRLTDTESMRSALRQYQKTLKDEFGDLISQDAAQLTVLAEESGEEVIAGMKYSVSNTELCRKLPLHRCIHFVYFVPFVVPPARDEPAIVGIQELTWPAIPPGTNVRYLRLS